MAGVEQQVEPQPIIKDVETLKANLKQEKRNRAVVDASADKPATDSTATDPVAVEPPTDKAESRKRRKVSEVADVSQAQDQGAILDGPIGSVPEETEQPVKSTTDGASVPHAPDVVTGDHAPPASTEAIESSNDTESKKTDSTVPLPRSEEAVETLPKSQELKSSQEENGVDAGVKATEAVKPTGAA